MGMAPCFTLHSNITLEGQQVATQLLAAAGANFFMAVGLNTDRMLAYFDTSAHDNQTLREAQGRLPGAEFLQWGLRQGIFARDNQGAVTRGPTWGDPRQFCSSDAEFRELLAATPAVPGLDNAGSGPANAVARRRRLNQAIGRDAIQTELAIDELCRIAPMRVLETEATTKEAHLNSPGLGARPSAASLAWMKPEQRQVQVLISDGLSAEAVHHNLRELLPVLLDGLNGSGLRVGKPIVARYGRVKLAEPVAERLQADLVVYLIGERPGGDALASRSLSAYLVYRLADPALQQEAARFSNNPTVRFEYSVISNIYAGGLPPLEAGAAIVEKASQILKQRAAGNRLEALLEAAPDVARQSSLRID
jgi:ethanolamine ammonia-lyase large subunit